MSFETLNKNTEKGIEPRELTSAERARLNEVVSVIFKDKEMKTDRSPLSERLSGKLEEVIRRQAGSAAEK